jgi:hypothetical protein
MTVRIGIVGGLGGVGRRVVSTLQAWGGTTLRVGGRDTCGRLACARLGERIQWRRVDALDAESLHAFCEDCAIVVNCAGPASVIGDTIALAACAAGADYVDASAYTTLGVDPGGQRVLLAAGMYPGLTGLAPRWLARDFDRVESLTAYVGGCDHLSPTAATDYLDSIRTRFGVANTAWAGGRRVAHTCERRETMVPFFTRPVLLQPYLTAEAECLARTLRLSDMRWYSVFDGRHVLGALAQGGAPLTAGTLVRAAEMDLFGREPYQLMLFELTGRRGAAAVARTLMLRARSGADLTGVAAAVAVRNLLEDGQPPGVRTFAEAVDPAAMPLVLSASDVVAQWSVVEEPLTAAAEEGEL